MMPIVTQTRTLDGGTWYRKAQWTLNGVKQATERAANDISGSQTTTSYRSFKRDEGAEDYNRMTGEELAHQIPVDYKTRYDNGHDFFTTKQWFQTVFTDVKLVNPSYNNPATGTPGLLEYFGPMRPQSFQIPLYPTNTLPTNGQLDVKGAKLIGMVAPTASEAAASVFLGELRADGLPKIPQLQAWKAKIQHLPEKESEEYINLQFGVKPFINDLKQMSQAVLHTCKMWKQLRRDSDRVIRRKASLSEVVTIVDQGTDNTSQGFLGLPRMNLQTPPPMFSSIPPQRVLDTVSQQYSFSGAFTYHLSEATSFLGKLDMYEEQANHLLGTEIDLETLWNLTRWSWLVDWFVDIGSFLHNVDLLHQDSLALRYGYVMCHSKTTRTRSILGLVPIGACSTVSTVSEAIVEAKQRRRATPYGFGLNTGAFSDQRWAILGALGLTRAPKALRRNE